MLFQEHKEDYSSLPQADDNRAFQELSLRAFRTILPVKDWVVRDERIEDAGVDASLELLINSRYTNQRCQVQLKSTSRPRDNNDSVSYSVKVSNLNYLLNGQVPIYVLYIVPRNELWFTWARDEQRRLDKDSPNWKNQESITLKFTERLTSTTLAAIREKISNECRFQSQIHEVLGRAAAGEMVRVCVDGDTLRSSDPQQLLTFLLEQGLLLVNAGRSSEVLEASNGLNPVDARQPRVQLVLGYAYYMQSQSASAVAALTQAELGFNQLSDSDKQFVRHLRDSCDFNMGRISFEEFASRQEVLKVGSTHSFAVSFRLSELRQMLYRCHDEQSRRKHVNLIHKEVTQLTKEPSLPDLLKHQAYNFWLYAEGTQLGIEEFSSWKKLGMSVRVGQPIIDINTAIGIKKSWDKWFQAAHSALKTAESFQHSQLMADALYNRVHMLFIGLSNAQLLSLIFSESYKLPTEESKSLFMSEISQAEKLYEQAGLLEGRQQAKLLKAQILIACDQEADARHLAGEVLPVAQAMQYPIVEKHAQSILNGFTPLQAARKRITENQEFDQDFALCSESDEELQHFALEQLSNLNLPVDRLPILEHAVFSMRDEARERVFWCRHIQLIENKDHTRSSETLYSYAPEQLVQCTKLNCRSVISSKDWQSVFRVFKTTHCSNCSHRQPKTNPFQK